MKITAELASLHDINYNARGPKITTVNETKTTNQPCKTDGLSFFLIAVLRYSSYIQSHAVLSQKSFEACA